MAQQGTGTGSRRHHSSPSCPWPLISKEALEGDTPSRLQGMPVKRERTIMGSLTKMLRQTGEAHHARDQAEAAAKATRCVARAAALTYCVSC